MIVPAQPASPANVADHYDELDPAYRRIWGEHVHHGYWATGGESPAQAAEALTRLVAQRLAPAAGSKLCDIGCGYGATAAWMAEHHRAEVTGFTLSEAQASVARARGDGRLTFIRRDWLENQTPDASFDGAYAIESSEHMADKAGFFAEAARTLKPGGRLVVCAWLAGDALRPAQVRYLLEPICREGQLPSMGSRADYERLAAAVGFDLRSCEDISRNVRRTWLVCMRRLAGSMVSDPTIRRLALSRATRNRSFILSLPRLYIALRTGAMHYVLFVWEKPKATLAG